MKKSKANTKIISFFRSKERPDYYIIYLGSDAETMLKRMTHIEEFENSGLAHVEVELAHKFITDKFETYDGAEDFLRFLSEHIATDHDSFPFYDCSIAKAWCKLDSYEPEKWLKAFEDFKDQQERERKKNAPPVQLKLF